MMPDSKRNIDFVNGLLAHDPISPELRSKPADLFKKVKRRLWVEKIIIGIVYVLIFSAAFLAFQQRVKTDNMVHAVCWTVLSVHILLWFLICFLRRVYRLALSIYKRQEPEYCLKLMKTDRRVFIWAVFIFVMTSFLLSLAFFHTEVSKAINMAGGTLWAPVFFIFWYPFGTATLLSKLYLNVKRLEINAAVFEEDDLNGVKDEVKNI